MEYCQGDGFELLSALTVFAVCQQDSNVLGIQLLVAFINSTTMIIKFD